MLKNNFFKNEQSFFITKRSADWWKPEVLDKTLHYIKTNNFFLINIIRDPRDVLLSKHSYLRKEHYYVDPFLWEKSIHAANYLIENLADDQKITIKYEDVILKSSKIQSLLNGKVGLELKPNISWDRLEENIELLCGPQRSLPYGRVVPLQHKLGNFSANSIGKWKGSKKAGYINGLLSDPQHGNSLSRFLEFYNYQT